MPDEHLDAARAAFAARSWRAAADAYAVADRGGLLRPVDLEDWGLAALLAGDAGASDAARERAHHAYLDDGDADGAARVAFWLALTLLMRGEPARAQGWFARPRGLLDPAEYEQSVWLGYDLLTVGMRELMTGHPRAGLESLGAAVRCAEEHGDPDLELLARNGRAQALLASGRPTEGMVELDEVMVLATTGRAGPQAVGQVFCASILVCRGCLDLSRSAEWTEALARWCEGQQGLALYQGQCVVHVSEVLHLQGRWAAALDEVTDVLDRLATAGVRDGALGMAHYQRGELHRTRGESKEAERSYRAALAAGHDPQPGLALLRSAQGRPDTALVALRRALAEAPQVFVRTRLLPAVVEVALCCGELDEARQSAVELAAAAEQQQSVYLTAVAAQASGAVALAEGRPSDAISALRAALRAWAEVGSPYEAARCRVLLARACVLVGDVETASLETDAAREVFVELGARLDLSQLDAAQPGARPPDGLTPRELEILRLVSAGQSNREIAELLVLSERTVARHVANIFLKIGVGSRAAATAYAYDRNLV